MTVIPEICQASWTKIIVAAILVFIGMASGVYVGAALIEIRSPNDSYMNHGRVTDATGEIGAMTLNLEEGDLFPLEDYETVGGGTGNFGQLLGETRSLLLFVDFDCEPCHGLLSLLDKDMVERLHPDVQIVACLSRRADEIPAEFAGLLTSTRVVFYDANYWEDNYDLSFMPTIIGVDHSGFIQHIQFGFEGYLDYPLVDYFFQPRR